MVTQLLEMGQDIRLNNNMRWFEIRRRVASSPEISLLNNNMRCFEICQGHHFFLLWCS